jgi:hypothetical protein
VVDYIEQSTTNCRNPTVDLVIVIPVRELTLCISRENKPNILF